jgi:hypothetical protein
MIHPGEETGRRVMRSLWQRFGRGARNDQLDQLPDRRAEALTAERKDGRWIS